MYRIPAHLLSTKNHKTIKGEGKGYKTFIMYLAPSRENERGINLCPHASAGCLAACLSHSGFARFDAVQNGRLNKANYFVSNRKAFLAQLVKEVEAAIRLHGADWNVVFRLNGTSDIRYEKLPVVRQGVEFPNIMAAFPTTQFYDYTKNPKRFEGLPTNYHLTFSRSESNEVDALNILRSGHNVAAVFQKVPTEYKGFPVINGDNDDLRFLDPSPVIVGLKYKKMTTKGAHEGNIANMSTGFVITS